MINLYPHQEQALDETKNQNHVAYYHDMGLGKTFTGAEKMISLNADLNLVICQKSKIDDWRNHFAEHYRYDISAYDLTKKQQMIDFFENPCGFRRRVGIINYELAFRRPDLKQLKDFTLMLDESSLIQNENAKRSKFILKLNPKNVILLSGTPTGGKYEKLWSQLHLLGWNISKELYWRQYIDTEIIDNEGFPIKVVRGYKNVDRLKQKLRDHGANFLKTEDVFDLPSQMFNNISVPTTKEYRTFKRKCIVTYKQPYDGPDESVEGFINIELVGDTTLTKMLYERQLCGQYNEDKLKAFRDLLESSDDRMIVFYNFTDECEKLIEIVKEFNRPFSVVNGAGKNLFAYEQFENSITFIQYQAGAMGLNLQKANKVIYFTPPLSSELFEQSKKRIHRIGQEKPCFYYYLTCKNSIEEKIYSTLAMRKDFTDSLFEEVENEY